ncbi:MAG: glycosyltransferase [Clostridia bacterium]|nr:glycosyltransferase [Clostridia bacterium]
MILQNIIFPEPGICTEEKLYFRRNGAEYTWANRKIAFRQGGTASFDTFFNGFSVEKWDKYTHASGISLKLKLYGDFRVTVVRKEKFYHEILTEFLAEKEFMCHDGEEVTLDFDIKKPYGMISFTLFCKREGGIFYQGAYSTETAPVNQTKLALDICTYRRESFVKSNVRNLYQAVNNQFPYLKDNIRVFVIDNANTLKKGDVEYGGFSKLIYNRNLGGSGGFTRGIVETLKSNDEGAGFTNILLMDDDIVFEPETIYRTFMLLSYMKEQYSHAFIGGTMLRLDRQNIQTEAGGIWNGGKLVSLKNGLDLNSTDACLYNEVEEQAEFNAWWYCTMPLCLIHYKNLPLPLFIRGDDVEYGLRNMRRLILMNGICVWHEPFENKYSSAMFYYIMRNRLIDNAVSAIDMSIVDFCKEVRTLVMRELVGYKYANVALTFRGIYDFLKGIDWFIDQDAEELNKEIAALSYKLDHIENLEVAFSYPKFEKDMKAEDGPGKTSRLLRLLTFNGQMLKAQGEVILPLIQPRPVCLYRKEKVLYYDVKSRKGFVVKKNFALTLKYLMELSKVRRLLLKNYASVARQYHDNRSKLSGIENWEKSFYHKPVKEP